MAHPLLLARTSATGSGTSMAVNKPSGTANGDFMFAWVVQDDLKSITGTPSGWTNHGEGSASNQDVTWFSKAAGGSEPSSYTWTQGTSSAWGATIVTFRRTDAVLAGFGQQATNAANPTCPSVTTATADSALICVITSKTSATITSVPSGMSKALIVSGVSYPFGVAIEHRPSTGATGTRQWTAGAVGWDGASFELGPAADGPDWHRWGQVHIFGRNFTL